MTRTTVPPRTAEKIILFGDSITQQCFNLTKTGFNFGAALASDYQRRLDVVNRGYGGYITPLAKHMIDSILEASVSKYESIALMVIFFGTNDASLSGSQAVPIEQYSANIEEITKKVLAMNIKVIIVGPGLFDSNISPSTTRSTESHRKFCDAAVSVAKKLHVAYVPLWYNMAESVGWAASDKEIPGQKGSKYRDATGKLFTDGLHFTGDGYKIYYDSLKIAIKESYPELEPANVTWRWPLYDDIDLDDIESDLSKNLDLKI